MGHTRSKHLDDGWECDEEAGGDGVEDGVEGRPVDLPEVEDGGGILEQAREESPVTLHSHSRTSYIRNPEHSSARPPSHYRPVKEPEFI